MATADTDTTVRISVIVEPVTATREGPEPRRSPPLFLIHLLTIHHNSQDQAGGAMSWMPPLIHFYQR